MVCVVFCVVWVSPIVTPEYLMTFSVAEEPTFDELTAHSFAEASFNVTQITSLASQFLHTKSSYLEFEGTFYLSNSRP